MIQEPVNNEAALARLKRTFIYCSSPATGSFDHFAAKYRSDDAMILVPDELAAILLQSA